jgi:hypothetical protein
MALSRRRADKAQNKNAVRKRRHHTPLIPAQAGIQPWVPAFAGTSGCELLRRDPHLRRRQNSVIGAKSDATLTPRNRRD